MPTALAGQPALTWPIPYKNSQQTGRSPASGPGFPHVKWTHKCDSTVHAWPVLGKDGTVIVGCEKAIIGLDPEDGSLDWEFATDAQPAKYSRVGPDGTIYVCTGNVVHALTAKGKPK